MPTAIRNRRTLALAAVLVLVLLFGLAWWLRTRADASPTSSSLPTRTVQAGAVEVTISPVSLNTNGAEFRINLDTHSGSLDLDLAQAAQLSVNGRQAPAGVWNGAAAGGHHREGTLSFPTAIPTKASVDLRVTGLSIDVDATWTAP